MTILNMSAENKNLVTDKINADSITLVLFGPGDGHSMVP